jgi:hypothetical protein
VRAEAAGVAQAYAVSVLDATALALHAGLGLGLFPLGGPLAQVYVTEAPGYVGLSVWL